jgi:hypothetical protein
LCSEFKKITFFAKSLTYVGSGCVWRELTGGLGFEMDWIWVAGVCMGNSKNKAEKSAKKVKKVLILGKKLSFSG